MSEMKPITRKEKIIAGENIPPITREEMFLEKYGGGGASGGADWNASEGEAGYVKNRTHYVEFSTIIEQQTIEGFAVMEGPIYAVQNPFIFTPTAGDKYIVHWDGDEYNVDAKEFNGAICIGNENYLYGTTGGDIPFAIFYINGNDVFVATESTAASHNICIEGEVVHKLDKKFLPFIGEIVFTGVMNADGRYKYYCNTPYAEARVALENGATARMILVNDNEITHLVLQWVSINDNSVNLQFFDINNMDIRDGVIKYYGDGTIGSGLE